MADETAAPLPINSAPLPPLDASNHVDQPASFYSAPSNEISSDLADNAVKNATYGLPGVVLGFTDTIMSSLGVVDKDKVGQWATSLLPSFGDYYQRNKEPLQTIGDLTGMVIPGMLGAKVIEGGGLLATASGAMRTRAAMEAGEEVGLTSRLLASVFTSGKSADELLSASRARSLYLAENRVINPLVDMDFASSVRTARLTSAGDTIKSTLATELTIAGTMNQSETLYPAENSFAENVLLSAAFGGVFQGADVLMMNKAVKRLIAQSAPIAEGAMNPGNLTKLDQMIFRAPSGNGEAGRDYGVTLLASQNQADKLAMENAGTRYADPDTAANAVALYKENANRSIVARNKIINEQLDSMGTDRYQVGLTSRYTLTQGDHRTLNALLTDNPTGLVGTIDIRATPTTVAARDAVYSDQTKFANGLRDKADEFAATASLEKDPDKKFGLLAQADTSRERAHYLDSLEHFYVEPDGSLVPAVNRNGRFWDNPIPTVATPRSATNDKQFGFRTQPVNPNSGNQIAKFYVDENGFWVTGANVNKNQLGTYEHTAMYAQMRRAVDDFELTIPDPLTGNAKAHAIDLADKDHWSRWEFVAGLLDKHGPASIEPLITLPQSMMNGALGTTKTEVINSVLLNKKFEQFNALKDQQANALQSLIKGNKAYNLTSDDIRTSLNLPAGITGEASPLWISFEHARMQNAEAIIGSGPKDTFRSLEHLQRNMQEAAFFPELTPFMNKQLPIRGNMLNLDSESKAVFITKKPLEAQSFSRNAMEYNFAQQHATVLQTFGSADTVGADLVKLISDNTTQSSAFKIAKQVDTLIEGSQPGKQIINQAKYNSRNNPAEAALFELTSNNARVGEKWIGDLYAPHIPVFTVLRDGKNSADLLKFNEYVQAKRHGWDLEPQEIKQTNAKGENIYGFQLQNTPFNQKRYQELFGKAMPEDGALMPSMAGANRGNPLFITESAFQNAKSIRDLGLTARNNQGAIATALGKSPSAIKEWWVPPRSLSGQDVKYITYPDGRTKTVVSGRTPADVNSLVERELGNLSAEERKQVLVLDQQTVKNFHNVQDEAFHGMVDYADWTTQTGRATGATGMRTIETGTAVLDDIITSLNNQFHSIIRRTRATLFESQINQANVLAESSGYAAKSGEKSIWANYINTIYGGQQINPTTTVGKIYKPIENLYDYIAARAWDKARGMGLPGVGVRENLQALTHRPEKEFANLEKQLGEHNPFKDVTDYVQSQFNRSAPPTMKQHMAALNNLTSTLTLRMFEVGNAVLNGVSLAATMPAVIRALGRVTGETDLEYAARTGAYGTSVAADAAFFNPARATTSAMQFMFSREGRDIIKRAAEAGYFKQEVAEMTRTLTAPQSGYIENLIKSGIDKVSKISDKSEELARQISFMTGYKIGKDGLKMSNERDIMMFANKFADDTIGNYRPQNRPQIFQGAVGMPLGLFQTFTWNYMQRILGYVENKQYRALATQYGMQAAVFGGQSIPGFQQFAQYFASGHDGENNPVDGLRSRFGEHGADLMLYGAVSNLSKYFGDAANALLGTHMKTDGINLWSRGDANVQRLPGLWSLDKTPVFNMAKNAMDAFAATANQFRTQNGLSTQHFLETLGTYTVNRPLRNLFEMAAGANVDQSGALISGQVNSGMSIAARLMGVRPMMESKEIEATGRLKAIEASQAHKMEILRENTRPMLRSGEVDDEMIRKNIHDYVDRGGKPEGYSRWLRDQYLAATVSKGEMKLYESLKDPAKLHDTLHLMNMGIKLGNQEMQ